MYHFEYFSLTFNHVIVLFLSFLVVSWLFHSKKTQKLDKHRICNSLSCIRCSCSIFSAEKLLKKWFDLQKTLNIEKAIGEEITKAITRDNVYDRHSKQAPTVFYLETIPGSKVWYTADDYPREVDILTTNIQNITEEFLQVFERLQDGWVCNEVPNGGWYLYHLINQGIPVVQNCKKCPQIMKLLNTLPSLMKDCVFGNVMFSVLLPGTSISRHCGPTNVRIRCHVPIQVPSNHYYITVANEKKTWQENNILIFDDSFHHEVFYHGSIVIDTNVKPRVILMLDFWHPTVNQQEKIIIKHLFAPL